MSILEFITKLSERYYNYLLEFKFSSNKLNKNLNLMYDKLYVKVD